jgi:recombination protein RecR
MDQENSIEHLIYLFSKLPGLGPRSARRIVLYLLEDRQHRMNLLAGTLQDTAAKVVECSLCFNIDQTSPCYVCQDEKRDRSTIAIVESVADLWALERSNSYKGLFHILGSSLSAGSGYRPEDLKLNHLVERAQNLQVKEIIIATNATLDGQTTAYYITEFFKSSGINITRLASGIPMGGELDYLDEGTLTAALNLRLPF